MSSDVPSSTRPDPEVGPSMPEHDPSEARDDLHDAEREEERSAGEALASEEGAPAGPHEDEAAEPVASASEESAPEEEPSGVLDEAEVATSDAEPSGVLDEAEVASPDAEPSGLLYVAETASSDAEPSGLLYVAETASSDAEPSGLLYVAETLASEDDSSEAPYDAETYGSEPAEAPYDDDESDDEAYGDEAYEGEGEGELLDGDLPQRRRRPLSGEEAAAALFHAKAILQAAAEAEAETELAETDDTAEAEPSEPAPDDEADYLRSRLRALSDAAAVVEADAALFDTEADPAGAALFDADAEPEAETLLYEAESALFRAEVALAEHEAELVAEAWDARTRAVCSYSGFAVGAALLDVHGQRFTGANVENASYNLGLCAERVALYHALTHGAGRFVSVAIVTEAPMPTSPCGACRQALWEFAPHAEILLVTRNGHQRLTIRDLLPHAFDHETLRAAGAATDDPAR